VADLSAAEFKALHERLHDQVPWGAADRRGALNHITPARVATAVIEARLGRTVTLAAPLATSAADNPEPGARHMKHLPGEPSEVAGVSFAADQLAMNIHGDVDSHIDALCHVGYNGTLYNGVEPGSVTSQGARELSIDDVHDGIVGRGVLLDIPRLRGVQWLEPGDHVTGAELEAAEAAQQVRVGPGDLLFVRVGHRMRRNQLGPWDVAATRAGLHPQAMEFVAERQVAALGRHVPARLPAVRRPVCAVRRSWPLVVPVRDRPAAAARRHRLPGQPHRHPVGNRAHRDTYRGCRALAFSGPLPNKCQR